MKSKNFQSYIDTINRVGFAQLIDDHSLLLRTSRFKASLIANPLSGRPYDRYLSAVVEGNTASAY